eukprot:TRINITY_DN12622_c0_g1_i1.p1 TRINITY_DN12622_c0_g1~~TRINITY_DN12622_c0_g1_i1.p1  ORF type:complete len:233 (+),score=59.83 TRINITY_DN12622_c0_g1_i1:79-777(+)
METQGLLYGDEKDSSSNSSSFNDPLLFTHKKAPEEQTWWKFIHALGFVTGGTTFILGTFCFFPDHFNWVTGFEIAGVAYTVGSTGFLTVDVLEFFTFTRDKLLRINIFASATGSFCYLIGSIFFIPELEATEYGVSIGIWGFILGSAFIAASQSCKVVRIWREKPVDMTAIGVEGGAFLGAFFFLVGTIMFRASPPVGSQIYVDVLILWMCGSVFFTLGGFFLTVRHACMGK